MPSTLPSGLLHAVREFTTTILNPYDLEELLHRLTDHATAITGSHGAGVMLAGEDGLGFAAASRDEVVQIEVLQDRIETGACHEAFTTNRLIVVEDLEDDPRWPSYRDRALELGFRAVIGVPMNASGRTIGVLNVYRRSAGPWSPDAVEASEIITTMGAGYVLHANQLRAQHDLADQLQEALRSRDTIGQAKGLLMARHAVDATEAFEMLRSLSQSTNLKLRDVAAKVVETEATAHAGA